MLKKFYGKQFVDILKEKNAFLASKLDEIKERGLEDWVNLMHIDKGSHAGYPHLLNVEHIANKIIPDHIKEKFSAGEIFLLLSTIFLHDIGKIITKTSQETPCGKYPGEKCSAFNKIINNLREDFNRGKNPPCRKPQWDHHRESESIIRENYATLGLPDERLAQYCGLLAYCHCLNKPPTIDQPSFHDKCPEKERKRDNYRTTSLEPYGTIRIPLLASIIRIADETDNLWTRAVRTYWFEKFQMRSKDLSKAFRRYIEDIEFCHKGECLIIHIPEMVNSSGESLLKKDDIDSINIVKESMKIVIYQWRKPLEEINILFNEVYIEYSNRLFNELNANFDPSPLGKVIQKNMKPCLENLFNALTKLFFGSYGHSYFTWQTLEAQVGRPLTNIEKWLVQKMENISPYFNILINLETDIIHIDITRDKIEEAKNDIIG